MTAYGELDRLLQGMHPPGSPSNGAGSIGSFTAGREHAVEIVSAWRDYSEQANLQGLGRTDQFTNGRLILLLVVVIDTLFIVVGYFFLLRILLTRARMALKPAEGEAGHAGQSSMALASINFASVALFVGAGADLLENALTAGIVWIDWNVTPAMGGQTPSAASNLWAGLLKAFSTLKVLGLGAVAFILLLVLVVLMASDRYRGSFRALGKALVTLRGQLIIVVLFFFLFKATDQTLDVVRRWDVPHALMAIGLTGILAYFTWESGRRLMLNRHRQQAPAPLPLGAVLIVGLVLLVGMGVFALTAATEWAPRGLAIPGGIIVLIVLASRLAGETVTFGPWRNLGSAIKSSPRAAWKGIIGFPRRSVRRLKEHFSGNRTNRFRWEGVPFIVLPQIVAGSILVLLGLAMLKASLGQLVYAPGIDGRRMLLLSLGGGIFLPAIAWLSFDSAGHLNSGEWAWWKTWPFWLTQVAVALSLVGLIIWAVAQEGGLWLATERLGTIGIVAGFLTAIGLLWALLSWWADHTKPPKAFLTMKRIPVFILLGVWLVLALYTEPGGFFNVRDMDVPKRNGPIATGITLEQAFDEWLVRVRREDANSASRPVIPMVIVSASGGGIRAAYWTASVLDCITEIDPAHSRGSRRALCGAGKRLTNDYALSRHIFTASGISGSSLGLVSYAAYLVEKEAESSHAARGWVSQSLNGDYVAPTLAWELFVEIPRSFLRFRTGMDRAEVLERAWERSWPILQSTGKSPLEGGLFSMWSEHPQVPLLVLNGTTVNEGCRFTSSILNGGVDAAQDDCLSLLSIDREAEGGSSRANVFAATRELIDFLCRNEDVRLSTGALLSARFPVISPSGRVEACSGERRSPENTVAFVVDGGYLDTSAASTVVELMNGLQTLLADRNRKDYASSCVVPF
ncbi:MAG: hypothetical protein ACRDHO_07085, partial [Actinomycetota bacterium]